MSGIPTAEFRRLAPVAAGFTAAQTSVTASPYFLGALISYRHFTASGAGILYAIEMGAFALAMLLVSPLVGRWSLRRIAAFGMLLMVVGQFGSATAGGEWALALLRFTVGLGSGLVSASVTAAGARMDAPERAYAVATATMTIAFALLYVALAGAGHFHGPVGMFLLLAAFTALLSPLVLGIEDAAPAQSTPGGTRSKDGWNLLIPGLVALAAMLCYNYGALAVWPFTEQIGVHIGMSIERISILTAIGSALASAGGLLASWLGTRFGRLLPLTLGLLLQGIGSVAVCHASTQLGFLATYSWYLGLWYFGYTYILAVAAAVDRPGRLAVLTGMGYPVSSAAGGLSAGYLVESYSLHSIGWLAVAGCSIALILLVPLCRWLERAPRASPAAATT